MSTQTASVTSFEVKDIELADQGKRRIEWAFQSMPILQGVRKHFIKTQPFAGLRVAACLHVTPETANLMITMRDGGASILLCAASQHSTHDDVAACLAKDYSVPVYAIRGESSAYFSAHLDAAVAHTPQLVIDDGCHLISALHERDPKWLADVLGATEESPAAASRLRMAAKEGMLRFPIVAVSESNTKRVFDSRYGAGQSTLDAIMRTTGHLIAGTTVVVAGFGGCGRGIAMRARGLGASVIVTEVDPVRALEALMDGYRVLSMPEAAILGDIFVTVSGNKNVIGREHFEKFKNSAILCNAGHSKAEIDTEALATAAFSRRAVRDFIEEFSMRDGRKIFLLADGRPVNMVAGDGQPSGVMDVSFANHALVAEYLVKEGSSLQKDVYPVSPEMDNHVAKLKLESMSVKIDRLTVAQEQYLASWAETA